MGNNMANWGLGFSLIGLFLLGSLLFTNIDESVLHLSLIAFFASLITSILALVQIKTQDLDGKGIALLSLVISVFGILFYFLFGISSVRLYIGF